eukprot:4304482-Pleurochrysis_carterae.AAC.1
MERERARKRGKRATEDGGGRIGADTRAAQRRGKGKREMAMRRKRNKARNGLWCVGRGMGDSLWEQQSERGS